MSDETAKAVRYVARVAAAGYLVGLAVAVGLVLTHHLSVWLG